MLTFIIVSILIGLGAWQLQRAQEKKHLLTSKAHYEQLTPVVWQGKGTLDNFQSIKITGRYLPSSFLLDNQYINHQWGYDVLSPFVINDKILLIDRGWVAGDAQRQVLPDVETPEGVLDLTGYVYFPSPKVWTLGQEYEQKQGVIVLEKVDVSLVQGFLHKPVYPFILRLNKNEPGGYIRQWPVVSMSAQRHLAYAWQWFSLALAMVVIFIGLSIREK